MRMLFFLSYFRNSFNKKQHEQETYFFIVISFCFLVKIFDTKAAKKGHKQILFVVPSIFCCFLFIFIHILVFISSLVCIFIYCWFLFLNESHFDLLLSPLFSGTGTYFLVWVMVMNKFCDFRSSVRRTK